MVVKVRVVIGVSGGVIKDILEVICLYLSTYPIPVFPRIGGRCLAARVIALFVGSQFAQKSRTN